MDWLVFTDVKCVWAFSASGEAHYVFAVAIEGICGFVDFVEWCNDDFFVFNNGTEFAVWCVTRESTAGFLINTTFHKHSFEVGWLSIRYQWRMFEDFI